MNTIVFDFSWNDTDEREGRKLARNFRRFIERRIPDISYQRGEKVIASPMRIGEACQLLADYGHIADITVADISVVPQ